jgi:dihydroorotate dehydrogenase
VADEAIDDALSTVGLLAPHADGIELNVSCPNVSWGRDRDNEAHLRDLVRGIRSCAEPPLFVKLPPFMTPAERDVVLALASIAQEAGAAGLTCSNTRPVGDARLSVGVGGLSGRALWDRTLAIVADIRATTGGTMAINACGGISSWEDVLACLQAGATTVQIYSALIYEGPEIVGTLTRGLARALEERGTSVRALAGASEPATG